MRFWLKDNNLLQIRNAANDRLYYNYISENFSVRHDPKYPGQSIFNKAEQITQRLCKDDFRHGRGYGIMVRRRTGIGRRVDGSQPYRTDMHGKAMSCRSITKTRHTLPYKKYMPGFDFRDTSNAFRSTLDRILGLYHPANKLKINADTTNKKVSVFLTKLPPISGQST